jgi:hypothetical protein
MTDVQNVQTTVLTDQAIDKAVLDTIAITQNGEFVLDTFQKMFQFATFMSMMDVAVRAHCRHNRAVCFALVRQGARWGIDPIEIANKSYVTTTKDGVQTLAYESQLVHAVIEKLAPLRGRLRVRYEGEGDDRVCIVSGTFTGETEPHEWRSPPLKINRIGRRSPLWVAKPDMAQFHDTVRDFGRAYCPDVAMGIYTIDELTDEEPQNSFERIDNPLADPVTDAPRKARGWPKGRPRRHTPESPPVDQNDMSIPGTLAPGVSVASVASNIIADFDPPRSAP